MGSPSAIAFRYDTLTITRKGEPSCTKRQTTRTCSTGRSARAYARPIASANWSGAVDRSSRPRKTASGDGPTLPQERRRPLGALDLTKRPWVSPVARKKRCRTVRGDRLLWPTPQHVVHERVADQHPASHEPFDERLRVPLVRESCHADPFSQKDRPDAPGSNVSTSRNLPAGRWGMKTPSLNLTHSISAPSL